MSKRRSGTENASAGQQVGGFEPTPGSRPLPGYADVHLLRPHTHAGRQHQTGETITVSEADARWLIDNGIGTAANSNEEK